VGRGLIACLFQSSCDDSTGCLLTYVFLFRSGTLHYRGAKIQVVDLPGIIEGAKDGKGRGRQVISAARTCNIILVVLVSQSRSVGRERELWV
jgi:ribosome-interacting GTPase 1